MASSNPRDVGRLHDDVGDRLREADQLYTSGRRRLVDRLADLARPVTIPELVDGATDLALSSAYRNLGVLEQVGVVSRVHSGGEHARFELAEDVAGHHHHHLICESCGRVDDFTVPAAVERTIDRALDTVASEHGFVVSSHCLDLFGTCEDCAAT